MEILTKKIAPNSSFSFIAPDCKEEKRIDKFISEQFPLYSRSFFQQLIDDELVKLNGQTVTKQSIAVKPSDRVSIVFPPERKVDKSLVSDVLGDKNIDVEIISEHPDFLIVYKPANLLVHSPSARSTAITLADWLLVHYSELANVGYSDRPAIVHRLDKDTSGLLVVPRTPYAHALFGSMFRNRTIDKTYYALVHGNPPKSGSIELAIGRDPYNRKKMAAFITPEQQRDAYVKNNVLPIGSAGTGKKVRNALTHYKVVEYFENCALVEVKLITGRMHQIRVHFNAIGHPVFGDPIYGNKSKLIKRQALHAHTISFLFDEKTYSFSKEVPEDFSKLLKNLRKSQ